MIDQFAQTIIERIKDQYPGIRIPGAMCAMITGAAEDGTYTTECKIFCEETGGRISLPGRTGKISFIL